MDKKSSGLASLFKALSDGNRLSIIRIVLERSLKCALDKDGRCEDQTCIKDIAERLKIGLPTVSHHVKELVNAELIVIKKQGRWSYLRINPKRFKEMTAFLEPFNS